MPLPTGIRRRHGRGCKTTDAEARCDCPYEASVYSVRDERKVRRTFARLAEAKAWRHDASAQMRKGVLRAPTSTTIAQAWEAWVAGAQTGVIRNRSGDPYKPAAIRTYQQSMRLRVLDDYGRRKVSDLGFVELQDFVDRLTASGISSSTVQGALLPLRALYARAVARGEVSVNPTAGLRMPRIAQGRDRVASPEEAAALIAAVPVLDQPLWATAMYAGLRRGELQALRWEDVDLERGILDVRRSWDYYEGEVAPKSAKGTRTVPIAGVLRAFLLRHRMASVGDGLVFPRAPAAEFPFAPTAVEKRAKTAWRKANEEGATLRPITPHECRHTFASLMIAAGVNAKALSTYMGHASVAITFDRYGHLMPGNEAEAANLLDAYLAEARSTAS